MAQLMVLNRRSRLRLACWGLVIAVVCGTVGFAADDGLLQAAYRVDATAAGWSDLQALFAKQPDTTADFEERRVFPFRKQPVVLRGEVRVSRSAGLSLHYVSPEERTVILDDRGVFVREAAGHKPMPIDPRANAANDALLHVLRLDFAALAEKFDVYGRRDGNAWSLGLVPHAADIRRAIGDLFVVGEGATVRTIELRRSAKQHIDILIAAPRSRTDFTAAERQRFFR